jgi:hypothetical protein
MYVFLIVLRFYKNWAEIHWKGRDVAEKAEVI